MRKTITIRLVHCLLLALAACASPDLIRNPSIERWCGDSPCEWKTEGTIRRVGTWHKNDYAVQLVSDDARIWQDNGTVTDRSARCFEFGMIAKVDPETRVFLELDFLADGSVEFSQRLPVSDWERLTFRITTPSWYRGVRFALRKESPGLAILAELSAHNATGQCSAPPVELLDRPDGAGCSADAQCRRGHCESSVCAGCSSDAECEPDVEVCALVRMNQLDHHGCVARGSGELGLACDQDAQCESGICNERACSECEGTTCEDGRLCRPAQRETTDMRYWPRLCGAGMFMRVRGEACTRNQDCESRSCSNMSICIGGGCESIASLGECA
jgi:hypothetical protein